MVRNRGFHAVDVLFGGHNVIVFAVMLDCMARFMLVTLEILFDLRRRQRAL